MADAASQLRRLLTLVPWLLAHPGTELAEVARAFDVSVEQLRADLDLIFVCGLPGHTPADLMEVWFTEDRVSVTNADTIARPLRLSTDEALALVVALRALADVPGLDDRDVIDRALAAIEQAAGAAAADADRVAVTLAAEEDAEADVLAAARDALARGRLLHLRYYVPARDETTERDVDPMRVVNPDGRWYLEGWCRLARDVRLFRLDRVLGIEVLDAPAEVPDGVHGRDLDAGVFQPSPTHLLATLELDPAARWVADYYPCEDVAEQPGGGLRVRLRAADPRWLRRLVLGLAGAARVVDPPDLADQVRRAAADALARYPA